MRLKIMGSDGGADKYEIKENYEIFRWDRFTRERWAMGGFWDESPRAQTCSLLMALQGEQYSLNMMITIMILMVKQPLWSHYSVLGLDFCGITFIILW